MTLPTERSAFAYFECPSTKYTDAVCGPGVQYQTNVQKSENPSFELLTAALSGQPGHDPELVKLAQEMNQVFQHKAEKLIVKKRKERGIPRLEITVHLAPEGLRLAFAYPRYRASRAPTPQWVLGGRFWLWLSRVVYHATHWRHARIPVSAKSESPAPAASSLGMALSPLPKIKALTVKTE